jgi:hypothetical protein
MTGVLNQVQKMRVDIYGSLAMTGIGHGTPNAILMGLEGETPEAIDPRLIEPRVEGMNSSSQMKLGGSHLISFTPSKDLMFHYGVSLPQHPNGLRFSAFNQSGDLVSKTFYHLSFVYTPY